MVDDVVGGLGVEVCDVRMMRVGEWVDIYISIWGRGGTKEKEGNPISR